MERAGASAGAGLADVVKQWRKVEGLSLERAGRIIGVAHTTVRDWERGRDPQPMTLHRLLRVLSLPVVVESCVVTESLGAEIRRARLRSGISQRSLARQMGVSTSAVSNWERCVRVPDTMTTDRLAVVIGLAAADARARARHVVGPATRPRPRVRLVRARNSAGLSRVLAAEQLGVGVRTLTRVERGERAVELSLVLRMARCYSRPVLQIADAAGTVVDPMVDRSRWRHGDLPEVLTLLRSATGLSVGALARLVGSSPRTVRSWERGGGVPPSLALERLEGVFGLGGRELRRLC